MMGDFSFELPLRRALQRNPPDLRIDLLPPRGLLPTATPVLCADTSLDGYGFVIHCLTLWRSKLAITKWRSGRRRSSSTKAPRDPEIWPGIIARQPSTAPPALEIRPRFLVANPPTPLRALEIRPGSLSIHRPAPPRASEIHLGCFALHRSAPSQRRPYRRSALSRLGTTHPSTICQASRPIMFRYGMADDSFRFQLGVATM